MEGGFACPKCNAETLQKEVILYEPRPTSQINGKAEYPWHEGNALYLVGAGYSVL